MFLVASLKRFEKHLSTPRRSERDSTLRAALYLTLAKVHAVATMSLLTAGTDEWMMALQ